MENDFISFKKEKKIEETNPLNKQIYCCKIKANYLFFKSPNIGLPFHAWYNPYNSALNK